MSSEEALVLLNVASFSLRCCKRLYTHIYITDSEHPSPAVSYVVALTRRAIARLPARLWFPKPTHK